MNDKQAISKFQGVSPVERSYRLRRIGMKKNVSFQLLVELKKIVREENEIEKNENESEEHSKVQELESRKICQNF